MGRKFTHACIVHVMLYDPDEEGRSFDVSTISSYNYTEHDDEVNAGAFTTDFSTLITASDDGRVRIFDTQNHLLKFKYQSRKVALKCVAIHPSDLIIASGGQDNLIYLQNLFEHEPIAKLKGHEKSVESLRFSKSGEKLFSGSWDRRIIVWDMQNFSIMADILCHESLVQTLVLSPDDEILVSGSFDQTICLRSVSGCVDLLDRAIKLSNKYGPNTVFSIDHKCQCIRLHGHQGNVKALAFSHCGKFLISGGWDTRVFIWNVEDLTLVRELSGVHGWVQTAAWSADDKQVVVCSDHDSVLLWQVSSGECIWRHEFDSQQTSLLVTFSGDKLIFAGSDYVLDLPPLPTNNEEASITVDDLEQ